MNIAGTNIYLRPTIAELAPAYVAVGIPPARAVRYIVDAHLQGAIARGHGNRAARRSKRARTQGNRVSVASLSLPAFPDRPQISPVLDR